MTRYPAVDHRRSRPMLHPVAAIALAALWLLAGCAPAAGTRWVDVADLAPPRLAAPAPEPPPAILPHFTATAFIATDGARLPLRRWLPQGRIRAVILALHGFNDYSHAFAGPAREWAARGIATYAYDQRGFGAAPRHGRWPGTKALAIDATAAAEALRRDYPGVPLYLLGESMGGAVAIVAMAGDAGPTPPVDGVILVAPAVWGRATMDLLPRVVLWGAARTVPALTLTGRGLGVVASDNLPMLRALVRDKLVIKATRVDAIYGLVDLMDAALADAPRLTAPLLLMYGRHDEIVPRLPVRRFVAALPPEPPDRRRLALYPNGYHMLLRDLDGGFVSDDVASWILHRDRPLPSGADRVEAAQPWPPHHRAAPVAALGNLPRRG